jgi:hypothetical protein
MSQDRSLAVTVAEGGLLSLEFIEALAHDRAELSHAPTHYGLGPGVVVLNEIARRWGSLREQWLALRSRDEAARLTGLREAVLKALDLGPERCQPLPIVQRGARGLEGLTRGERSAALEVRQARRQPDGLEVTPDGVLVWRLDAPADVREPLDERGYAHAEGTTPHAALQGFLNDESGFLWGVLCDGLRLRLLRDHYRISRQAYLEWDLVRMLEEARYHDFKAMWLIAHHKTLAGQGDARIEEWGKKSRERGVRAWETLEAGVKDAIRILATGLLHHHRNHALTAALANPDPDPKQRLDTDRLYKDCLRLIYRLIFLLVAEAREVLHAPVEDGAPDAPARLAAQHAYAEHYSVTTLARRAARERGGAGLDVWEQLKALFATLCGEHEAGRVALELPLLGSQMWRADFIHPTIEQSLCANEIVFDALRALCFTREGQVLQPVNWRGLGAEELGSVYEALLGYQMRLPTLMDEHGLPSLDLDRFELVPVGGSERKTSGSYYTPTALVELLLSSALEPVMADALAGVTGGEARAEALLNLKVCDPACGSGHFLLAAANRLAHKVATERAEGEEPTPAAYRHALRQVIARCIYGVDKNEMAVELCKVALWIESVEPGKPLAFLDAHIQQGNSLLGATPALMREPHPANLFAGLEGDDADLVKLASKAHKVGLKRHATDEVQQTLGLTPYEAAYEEGIRRYQSGDRRALRDAQDSLSDVAQIDADWLQYLQDADTAALAADMWCAAFVWPVRWPADMTVQERAADSSVKRALALLPTYNNWTREWSIDPKSAPADVLATTRALAKTYEFFHWHLRFPDVYTPIRRAGVLDWTGGFDVVLGNPPWEQVQMDPQEWFAKYRRDIADAPNMAARERMIAELEQGSAEERALLAQYKQELRELKGFQHIVHSSGLFPFTSFGRLNTYSLFAEHSRRLVSDKGRIGIIVPSGIATDSFNQYFFDNLVETRSLVSLYDFENKGLFQSVHNSFKFSSVTVCAEGVGPEEIEFAFFLHHPSEIVREGESANVIMLSASDIRRINPNTGTCPIFRSRRDADLTRAIYSRVPVLELEANASRQVVHSSPWAFTGMLMFMMNTASRTYFRTKEQLEAEGWTLNGNRYVKDSADMLPLYEAKMMHHYTHRWASYDGVVGGDDDEKLSVSGLSLDELRTPDALPRPRYWVATDAVDDRLKDRWDRGWLLGWRDICRSTDERTVIAAVIPKAAVGDTFLLALPQQPPDVAALLLGILASFVFDYVARQKVGGTHLKFHVFKQLPVLPPQTFDEKRAWTGDQSLGAWVRSRAVELTYTAWDMEPFARDCGDRGAPFVWDEARRFRLRAELDAAMFHLYGITREEDVRYIMGTFKKAAEACEEIVRVWGAMGRGEAVGYTPGARHPGR